MQSPYRVAVVIPTYNRWPTVCDAIDSALQQGAHVLPIVVDDASSDGTFEHLRAKYGEQIKLLRQPTNQEKSAARNAGIQAAETEYICFLDSDDLFVEGAIDALLAIFEKDQEFNGAAYGGSLIGDAVEIPIEQLPEGNVLHRYVQKPFLHTLSFLMRRNVLLDIGLYNESLTNLEDIDLFIRLMARLEFRCTRTLVGKIRKQEDSASKAYQNVIRQGTGLLDSIMKDEFAITQLGDHWKVLQAKGYDELLRALYKSACHRGYCRTYRALRSLLPKEARTRRNRRRFAVSKVLGLLREDPTHE
jgi:glycosyltransferase involved in cell wall biosynthesis